MTTSNLVCIVVTTYNDSKDATACVRSLLRLDYEDFKIVLLDNGSADDSYDVLSETFASEPRVDVVRNAINNGCAGGINAGLAYARRYAPAFYWMLNNDVEVDPAALRALVDAARVHPEAGCFCSKIYFHSDPDVLWYASGSIQANRSGRGIHRGSDEVDRGQYDSVEPTEFATGCSIMARAQVLDTVGGWSEDYYLYWEDIDWSVRAQGAGWQCLYVPESVVWHKISRSFGGDTALQRRYEARSRLRFYWRNRRRSFLRVLFWMTLTIPAMLVHGETDAAIATSRGIGDFLLGRTGPIADKPKNAA